MRRASRAYPWSRRCSRICSSAASRSTTTMRACDQPRRTWPPLASRCLATVREPAPPSPPPPPPLQATAPSASPQPATLPPTSASWPAGPPTPRSPAASATGAPRRSTASQQDCTTAMTSPMAPALPSPRGGPAESPRWSTGTAASMASRCSPREASRSPTGTSPPPCARGSWINVGDIVGTVVNDHVDVKMRDLSGRFIDFAHGLPGHAALGQAGIPGAPLPCEPDSRMIIRVASARPAPETRHVLPPGPAWTRDRESVAAAVAYLRCRHDEFHPPLRTAPQRRHGLPGPPRHPPAA